MTTVAQREAIERNVLTHMYDMLVKAGWKPTYVDDGEDFVPCHTVTEMLETVFSVEASSIQVEKVTEKGRLCRHVEVVLGNDGWDCISDYSTSRKHIREDDFEAVMDKVGEYCDQRALAYAPGGDPVMDPIEGQMFIVSWSVRESEDPQHPYYHATQDHWEIAVWEEALEKYNKLLKHPRLYCAAMSAVVIGTEWWPTHPRLNDLAQRAISYENGGENVE